MDWASLAAFVAVAEHGGFSAAAGQLHLTQPAVSKRIAALEQSLQARLFDRLGRQVVLTEAGRALLPRARQMLAEAEAARRALQDLGQDIGGRLSLATSHHVGLHRLPALLRHFTALHPRAALDIRFMDSEQAYAQVLQGQVDLAVTTLGPSEPPLRATPVWNDPLLFAVAPDHPLAAAPQRRHRAGEGAHRLRKRRTGRAHECLGRRMRQRRQCAGPLPHLHRLHPFH